MSNFYQPLVLVKSAHTNGDHWIMSAHSVKRFSINTPMYRSTVLCFQQSIQCLPVLLKLEIVLWRRMCGVLLHDDVNLTGVRQYRRPCMPKSYAFGHKKLLRMH